MSAETNPQADAGAKLADWPLFDCGPDAPHDERTPGVLLLERLPEDKRTAEMTYPGRWLIVDWEQYDVEGVPHWFARSSYTLDADVIDQLAAARAAAESHARALIGASEVRNG